MRALAAVLCVSTSCAAVPAGAPGTDVPAVPIPANGWDQEKLAQHLLNRAAFGPSTYDRARIAEISLGGWLYEQLQAGSDDALEAQLAHDYPTLQLSVTQALQQFPSVAERARQTGQDKEEVKQLMAGRPYELPRQLVLELTQARLMRAVKSRRQLEEVLVDFWFNHFNVSAEKGKARWLLPSYERDAIRPFVFGRFKDLLAATARHPAMLVYLDNWMSVREGVRCRRSSARWVSTRTTRASCSSCTPSASTPATAKTTCARRRACSPAGASSSRPATTTSATSSTGAPRTTPPRRTCSGCTCPRAARWTTARSCSTTWRCTPRPPTTWRSSSRRSSSATRRLKASSTRSLPSTCAPAATCARST
ncbi:MAG: DUF1800 family protein [Archangiaceae bacterium]|nr:DUF1800 family protein [Archangiaceae bacterium]